MTFDAFVTPAGYEDEDTAERFFFDEQDRRIEAQEFADLLAEKAPFDLAGWLPTGGVFLHR